MLRRAEIFMMEVKKMELSKDDWILTLGELKSQRTQLKLQLGVVEFGIEGIETVLKAFPKESGAGDPV